MKNVSNECTDIVFGLYYEGKDLLYIHNLSVCANALIHLELLEHRKIAILGYGKEGRATTRFLLDQGIDPNNITLLDSNESLSHDLLSCVGGASYMDNLEAYHILFRSPGIHPHHPQLTAYTGHIMTQTQLFLDIYPGKIIGITGTKGKTTISSLVYRVLIEAGFTAKLVGNVGTAVLDEIAMDTSVDRVVMELSSYQLHQLTGSLDIAIYNNLYHEHHVDRHGSFDAYKADKSNILSLANYSLVGSQLIDTYPELIENIKPGASYDVYGNVGTYVYKDTSWYARDEKVVEDSGVLLPGHHNRVNICAVLGLCDKLHISYDYLKNVLHTFSGVEHRLENIGTYHGIVWINDAIATTPQSTIAALDTYKDSIDTIFLGGKDGGYNFAELIEKLAFYDVKNVVLFPDSGLKIKALLDPDVYTICITRSMKEAVAFAKEKTEKGKIALLSCASPSYSLWKNFEEKGREFKEEVVK